MKELDELITYIETDLLPDNCDKELIHDAICRYAELWHKKQAKDVKSIVVRRCDYNHTILNANDKPCNAFCSVNKKEWEQ